MGQSLKKLAPGSDENKEREIGQIIEGSYEKVFWRRSYQQIVEGSDDPLIHISLEQYAKSSNKLTPALTARNSVSQKLRYSRKFMKITTLDKGQQLEKEEFRKILQEIIIHSGFTGFGSKDTILFIFGIPLITYFIKQRVAPKSIPNEVFIPGVTSASVYLLAKLNKT
ncbi:hypothetical protein OIU85_015824 [Salix viminalis]|uniref:Uncharacterized protein n=1 Tax=Salix viminalis TaxID=40686 RepID=A0A9Q0V4N4_SALVM|nr:hypothetical protein OIU85_015824 [Salix viminalis]